MLPNLLVVAAVIAVLFTGQKSLIGEPMNPFPHLNLGFSLCIMPLLYGEP